MAITKNKIQLIDKAMSLELEMELDYYCYYWNYYYEDYDYDWEDEREPCWSYLDLSDDTVIVETFRYGKRFKNGAVKTGRMIDMDTIYSREKLREKKINQILGLEKPTYVASPTLGDFFPEKL